MSTRSRRVIATACVLAATFTLATASTSTASSEVPDDIEVLFSRGWANAPGNWDGTQAPAGVLQVEFGFRVAAPTLTMHEKGYYELPGVTARAIPEDGAAAGTGELDCHVPAPGDLDSLTPEYADVHCYGSVMANVTGGTAGRVFAVAPTGAGDRSFAVDWQPITYHAP